ncbi:unnamed protein product, partial [marine sediment metagenome]
KATTTLKDGQVITVDGANGKVYDGKVEITVKAGTKAMIKMKTKTKLHKKQPQFQEPTRLSPK